MKGDKVTKKKIAFSMKSDFAFNRLVVTLNQFEVYRRNLDIYRDNLKTRNSMEDLLDIWNPDLVILDAQIEEFQRVEDLLVMHDIPIIYFYSDYDALIEQINIHFGFQEELEQEKEEERHIEYIQDSSAVKEKVIIQDRIVEKEILKTEYTAVDNKLIVVASLWPGAGSTTFAINLARAIAERGLEVSYVEYPLSKPYMFDYLSISLKEEEKAGEDYYVDVAKEIFETGVRKNKRKVWKEHGVNWFVIDSRLEPFTEYSYEQLLQFTYSVNSVIIIFDVSSHLGDPDVQKFLYHADEVFVCIEPDPVKIDWMTTIRDKGKILEKQRIEQRIITFLNEAQSNGEISYHFIATKFSDYMKKQELDELWDSIDKQPVANFPVFPYEDIISCVWDSTFLYDDEEYQEVIEDALKPVISKILPRDFYYANKKSKKKSIFNNLINLGKGVMSSWQNKEENGKTD